MFPTFISILDIQSWWEVPSIAHFCSLFRTAFNLLDFDIEDLEEALLTDGTEEPSWLQELIVLLLKGCLPNNEISIFNYQMFLRRLFRKKCQEHDLVNPFNTDEDFQLLPLRVKVDILHALCDFRLEADDVFEKLKNLESDSLRVEPLGYDVNRSAYWYFYGTRLYREDKPETKKAIWQVISFTLNDWTQLVKKFENSSSSSERALFHTLNENFIPELPRLFKEKESLARKRLIERLPRRTSDRLRNKEEKTDKPHLKPEELEVNEVTDTKPVQKPTSDNLKKSRDERRGVLENRINTRSLDKEAKAEDPESEDNSEGRYEMAGAKTKDKKSKNKQQKDTDHVGSRSSSRNITNAQDKGQNKQETEVKPVGRQTNNSLASATGQILIQQVSNPNRKKLKTSQVFSQTEEDLQTGLHKILDHVKDHGDAWPFIEPVEEEYAPNYYTIIRKPMDLQRMEERLESGHYKTFSKFKTDFQLIVNNCRLYNGVDNEYSEMVDTLLEVFDRAVERYLDQITSSDEEIAVEYPDSDKEKASKKKKNESVISNQSKRKPTLAAQTDKKKERSPSPEPEEESPYESEEEVKPAKRGVKKEEPIKAKKEEPAKGKKEDLVKGKKQEPVKGKKEEPDKGKKEEPIKGKKEETVRGKKEEPIKGKKEELVRGKKEEPIKGKKEELVKGKKEEPVKGKKDKGKVNKKEKEKEITKNNKKRKEPSEEPEVKSKRQKVVPEEKEVVRSKKNKDTSEESEVVKSSRRHKEVSVEKDSPPKNSKKPKDTVETVKQGKKEVEKKVKKVEEKKKPEAKKPQKPLVEEKKGPKKLGRKQKTGQSPQRSRSRSFSRSPSKEKWSSSPPPSWPPSSPESRFDFSSKKNNKKSFYSSDEEVDSKGKHKQKNDKWKEIFKEDIKPEKERSPSPPKHKDKHNKLRETIEKLKAKSDLTKLKERDLKVFDFESEKTKENVDLASKVDKSKKEKEIVGKKKNKKDDYEDDNSTVESVQSENKGKNNKKTGGTNSKNNTGNTRNAAIEALTLATEQTLKDINKWLDDTPRFPEFSSDSNSPSHFCAIDDFDNLNSKNEQDTNVHFGVDKKKVEKPAMPRKDGVKDMRKRPFPKDPSKQMRRREIQRTIDRLQPGKSKGNLITNVQSATKTDELFPMGPLSKIKDTKNSLIVKTDESAPKLSLGSVLDSFGKHKFVDDELKKEEDSKTEVTEEIRLKEESDVGVKKEETVKDEPSADPPKLDNSPGKATPNLSAWFKAFGAPKVQPTVKKPESKEEKPEVEPKKEDISVKKVPDPEPSPNPDSPVMHGQPIPRQRKISTGSSMSERSSFSQDMDSPRVGIDERLGAYPAPYPSPLHKSPSGASPSLRSPLPEVSPKATSYPFNGQIRVGFYQDTVSTKSSPDKSCSPRDNPQSPYSQYSEHVYTPQTTQSPAYSYNNPYYSQPPSYSTSNPTPPYNPEQSPNPPSYYDTSKPLTDQYQAKNSLNSPVNINPVNTPVAPQEPSPRMNQQQASSNVETYKQAPNVEIFQQQNSPSIDPYNQAQQAPTNVDSFRPTEPTKYQIQPQQPSPTILNKISQPPPNVDVYNQPTAPTVDPYRSQQLNIDEFRQQLQQQQQKLHQQQLQQQQQQPQQPAPAVEAYRAEQQPVREKPQQPTASFPVKKRAYSEIEQVSRYDEQYNRNSMDMSLMPNRLPSEQVNTRDVSKYVHQNIPEPRQIGGQNVPQTPQQTSQENNPLALRNVAFPSTSNPYNYNETYPINIPAASTRSVENERKVDMPKYTNVNYASSEMNFARNPQQYNKPEINYTKISNVATEQSSTQRFTDNSVMNISTYKPAQTGTSAADSSANVNNRLENVTPRIDNYKPEVSIPRPTYSSSTSSLEMDQSLALRGNLANLTHIVDRYQNDERMMSGLQTGTPSYYADKNLPSQHMFTKPITSSSSGLPMFSQPNTMPYSHNIQSTASVYNRPMPEMQNPPPMLAQDRSTTLQQQIQEKKSKRRKTSKTATPPTSAIETAAGNGPVQGFQSYSGLKNSTAMEPSAISLKTASVVPGSAFNFGPTATGLALGTGLYGDKDAYPNFLEDFRSAPNYYMAAAAAAHHRSTPESGGEKPVRAAHQSSNPQAPGYPFIGAPQPRLPSYPLPGPFMPPHQGSLMDASSPLYQQYLQAGVLHQGLLGPPGAYPPGYHPALAMRQPYDSMTRPSWP